MVPTAHASLQGWNQPPFFVVTKFPGFLVDRANCQQIASNSITAFNPARYSRATNLLLCPGDPQTRAGDCRPAANRRIRAHLVSAQWRHVPCSDAAMSPCELQAQCAAFSAVLGSTCDARIVIYPLDFRLHYKEWHVLLAVSAIPSSASALATLSALA